jgi:hypothetical protein
MEKYSRYHQQHRNMKQLSLILVLFSLAFTTKAQIKYKVELEFKYTKPDCSAKANKNAVVKNDSPLANQKLYVYKDGQPVDSLKTDDEGKVFVKYYPGVYSLFEPWKHFKKTPDGSPTSDFFADCLAKEWAKPSYKLTVAEGDFRMDYHDVSASRCPNQYVCLKVRHIPGEIKR